MFTVERIAKVMKVDEREMLDRTMKLGAR